MDTINASGFSGVLLVVMAIRKIDLMNGLQKVIKLNEKVIKLDEFWGAVVLVFSDPLFPLKYTNLFYAKLVE